MKVQLHKCKNYVIIDEECLLFFLSRKWRYHKRLGVMTKVKQKTVYFHREIMECPDGMVVDHIDGDKLNNSFSNLRVCTQKQNVRNRRVMSTNVHGYKGVFFDNRVNNLKNRWICNIRCDGKNYRKRFFTKIEAAKQYDIWALELFGEFAKLNFPKDIP